MTGTWDLFDSAHQTYLRWAGIPIEYDIRPYLAVVTPQKAKVSVVGIFKWSELKATLK